MNQLILQAVLLWSQPDDPIAEQLECAAEVRCAADAQSCDVAVAPGCAVTLEACLDATVRLQGREPELEVLGCSTDARTAVVDHDAVRAARARRNRP
jgi:hypothetical protein